MDVFDLSKLRMPSSKKEKINIVGNTDSSKSAVAGPLQVEIVQTGAGSRLIADIFLLVYGAWVVMLGMGALHANHQVVPLISYWDAFWALLIFGTVAENMRGARRWWDKKKD